MNERQPDESRPNLGGRSTLGLGNPSRRRRRPAGSVFGKPLLIVVVLGGAALGVGAYLGVIDPAGWTAGWLDGDSQDGDQPGSTETLDGLAMRLQAAEEALAGLVASSGASEIADALSEDVAEFSGNFSQRIDGMTSTLESLRARVESVAGNLGERIRTEVDGRTAGLWDELGDLRTEGESTDAAIRGLEQEISLLKQEIATVQADNRELRLEVNGSVTRLTRELGAAQSRVDRVEANISRKEADFTLDERRRTEVAEGILVYVFDADPARQRATGTLHIVEDGRVLTFEDQRVGQAFVFSTEANRLQHELVFTRVTRDQSVAGYVRIPDGMVSEAADGGGRAQGLP